MAEVAVVVTSYGLGRTLGEALDSVRAQTLPPRELLVVDDGSADALTLEALARAEADGVRVVRTPNRGVSAARNLGARLTAAPYLAFLDGDDLLAPSYLAAAAARLDAEPALGFVTSGLRGFGATEYEWTPPPLTLDALLHHQPPHISSLLRRSAFAVAGGFDEALRCYEDLDLWLSFLTHGVRGEVLPEPLLAYRTRGDSLLRGALRRPVHVAAMEHLYEKHGPWLARHGEAMLVAKQGFLLELNQHRRHLHHLREEAERELAALRAEAAALGEELAQQGIAAVDWGDLRRPQPLTPTWGEERGRPVDRAVIEAFLDRHRADVRGRVLEVKDPGYSRFFGGDRVTHQDVLDVDPGNPQATIVADLGEADSLPPAAYDCIVLTQTLGYVLDPRRALANLHRALAPGGVLLFSVGGQTRIEHEGRGRDGDYWRFTEASLRELFAERFPLGAFALEGHGNVTLATAFLHGIAAEELTAADFAHVDPYFPVVYCVRAVKPSPSDAARGVILAYHRIGDAAADPLGLTTSPEDFRAHLELLRRELRPMALDELVEGA
ncbi:MAG TPA: glycosyltransferase, partial [Thermoanaerobaculia bacterium]|nr:glycosyltransferase [Thermoanaerobaculia bacterium]